VTVPVSIKRADERTLRITWSDGEDTLFPLEFLRDECPCAGCRGEDGLLGVHYAAPQQIMLPGRNDLKKAVPVGKYAIQLVWGDKHDTGIYSWQYLQALARELQNRNHSE